MNYHLGDYFVKDKSCLIDDPWNAKGDSIDEKRAHWLKCAGERGHANFIMGTVILLVILVFISLMVWASSGQAMGMATLLFGTVAVLGLTYSGTVMGKKRAELEFENYINELDSAKKRGEPEAAFIERKRQEKMQMKTIDALTASSAGYRNAPLINIGNVNTRRRTSLLSF